MSEQESLVNSHFLGHLSAELRNSILSKGRLVAFERGSTICLQGEPAFALKIVLSGWVKLFRVLPNGSETVLSTLSSGQSFDEIAALQKGNSLSSVEAVSDCALFIIDLSKVCTCNQAFREISNAVMAVTSTYVEEMMGEVEQLKAKTGTQRLTDYLISLCVPERNRQDVVLPFEKVVLAGKLGMKPESLSRAFAKLKPLGVNSDKRQVQIKDMATLKAFSEEINLAA